MSIENSGLRFLKGAELSGVDTHDPRADSITSAKAAPRQIADQFTLSGSSFPLTLHGVNHRSSNAERFANSPAVTENSPELPMSEIFNPDGTARLSKDLFFEGVRQAQTHAQAVFEDVSQDVADVGNLLLDMFKQVQKNSKSN